MSSYYWIITRDEDGKPYIVTGGNTEEAARQSGLEMLGGLDFEIRKLPTINKDTASSYVKGSRLKETHSLKAAGQRVGRDKSLRRYLRKRGF